MIEVVVKVWIRDREGMEKKLLVESAEYKGTVKQADEYFDFPDMWIFSSGGAFRVRAAEGKYRVTYKGVKKDTETTSREEIEIAIESAEKMIELLKNMGFIRVRAIKKVRKVYSLAGLKVSLDEVEGLGSFLELEGMANGEVEYADKKGAIFTLIDLLGVPSEDISQKSYLEFGLRKG